MESKYVMKDLKKTVILSTLILGAESYASDFQTENFLALNKHLKLPIHFEFFI